MCAAVNTGCRRHCHGRDFPAVCNYFCVIAIVGGCSRMIYALVFSLVVQCIDHEVYSGCNDSSSRNTTKNCKISKRMIRNGHLQINLGLCAGPTAPTSPT